MEATTVEILWDTPEADYFEGAQRLWKFHLDHEPQTGIMTRFKSAIASKLPLEKYW